MTPKFWTSKSSEWRIPDRMGSEERRLTRALQKRLEWCESQIWIASSGTTRLKGIKWIGLSKEAFLTCSEGVNKHLRATAKDRWLNVLPTYHVGGLSIFSRAYLAGCEAIDHSSKKWDPVMFHKTVSKQKITLSSLVPTQVHDLVTAGLHSPPSLRAVVIGGAALDADLYRRARDLGWPLLPSFGMSECGSQVATATLESLNTSEMPLPAPLSHVELKTVDGKLWIRSKAVCSLIAKAHPEEGLSVEMATPTGWLKTDDHVEITDQGLKVFGRGADVIKILGELVVISDVESRLRTQAAAADLRSAVIVMPVKDPRRGYRLIAVVENPEHFEKWRQAIYRFNESTPGLHRLSQWYAVDTFPKTALGKIQKAQLKARLGFSA